MTWPQPAAYMTHTKASGALFAKHKHIDQALIHISLVAGKPLLFSLDDIKKARELGIVGTLVGTLPAAPQQNLFQGVPLQLMLEECAWLIHHGHAFIVSDKQFIKDLLASLTDDEIAEMEALRQQQLDQERKIKAKEYQQKMVKRGVVNPKQNDALLEQALPVTIPDTASHLPNHALLERVYSNSTSTQERIIRQLGISSLSYAVFDTLKSRGYFLASGLRFGTHFIAYPGDPLRFHAHLIVNPIDYDEDIGLMNVVGGGRLATGVKKLLTIGSTDDEEEVKFFSIEWAGFG